MTVTYNKSSPYYSTAIENGYLDVMTSRDIPSQRDDILFTVTKQYENRPELLAYDLYGDVNLWWVFAVRNKNVIKDPLFDFNAGLKIYLPKLSTLKDSLGL
jgi:hypothetical protein